MKVRKCILEASMSKKGEEDGQHTFFEIVRLEGSSASDPVSSTRTWIIFALLCLIAVVGFVGVEVSVTAPC